MALLPPLTWVCSNPHRALVACSYLVRKHGVAKAKTIVGSIISREAKILCGLVVEVFDVVGDYGMFFGIHAMYHDTAENRAKATPVYIPALVFLIVSTMVSMAALAVAGTSMVQQMRRRQQELQTLGQRQEYLQLLRGKIKDAERKCRQTYMGVALAAFECLPMGCIGMYWFIEKYSVPWTQVVSLFTSALALGMKIASVPTLPHTWEKLEKWQASARPVGEGIALVELVGNMPDADEDGAPTLGNSLLQLRTINLAVARRAERESTATTAAIVAKLMKMDHVLLQFVDALSAPSNSESALAGASDAAAVAASADAHPLVRGLTAAPSGPTPFGALLGAGPHQLPASDPEFILSRAGPSRSAAPRLAEEAELSVRGVCDGCRRGVLSNDEGRIREGDKYYHAECVICQCGGCGRVVHAESAIASLRGVYWHAECM